ncbi:zinc-binding dehydrogenase [Geomonas sp. RF6]|uniref:MDR/zinc-dependent alcohol dehydrogenase-like family protein n=1 Tax=Geomonas sp. RF6 TaxID=2897342 RepID=UPI001E4461C9|nr:zinc-binding dehydrogenase [Geomonas sp. RF6]UFS72143.1 zinc-binding dehydrogenase [Geomonas sp. RF6]
MTGGMRAAVITGPGEAAIAEVAIPTPGAGELLVALEGCGVCASNIPLWEGRPWFSYPAPPGSPGHEGWGTVQGVGARVSGIREGDRVTLLSYHAYAEFEKVPAKAVVKLPDELSGVPFPGESMGCALNVFKRSDIRSGQRVAVIGTGFLGLIVTALAARKGAEVTALSRRRSALDLAVGHGAAHAVILDDHQRVLEEGATLSGGKGFDRVIEATGHQWPLDLAGELVRERGKVVLAGFHQDGPRSVNVQLWNWKGIDVINAHEREERRYLEGIRAAIEAVQGGAFRPAELVTHSFPLDELSRAYHTLIERPDGFIKGAVRMTRGGK